MKIIIYSILFFVIVIELYSQPNLLWQKTLGGSKRETCYSIVSTKDGGSIVCIETTSDNGDVTKTGTYSDYWVVKLTVDGGIEWQKTFEGNGSDRPTNIIESNDGGYVIAGGTHIVKNGIIENSGNWDAWIIKITSNGDLVWEKKYGGLFTDGAISIINSVNNGFYFVGANTSNIVTGYDAWIVKMSSEGNLNWSKTLVGNLDDRFFNVKETLDSGLLCVGSTSSTTGDLGSGFGDDDGLIVKFDKDGILLWFKRYGRNKSDILRDAVILENGNILAVGYSESYGDQVSPSFNSPCLWAILIDKNGENIWEKIFPGEFGTSFGFSIKKINDNSFIIAGGGHKNHLDFRLINIDSNGEILWDSFYGGSNEDMATSLDISNNNTLYLAGYTFSEDGDITNNKGTTDAWIIKLQMQDTSMVPIIEKFLKPVVNPNPSSDDFHVKVEIPEEDIYDIQLLSSDGTITQKIFEGSLSKGINQFTVSTANLPSGTYFFGVKNSQGVVSEKVVLIR